MDTIPSALQSSDGSGNYSTSLMGLWTLLAGLIAYFCAKHGIVVDASVLAAQLGLAIGSLITIVGLFKKASIKVGNAFSKPVAPVTPVV